MGVFLIAQTLTDEGVLSPSAYDRARNRHRTGIAWSKGAVQAILANPRYTGYQVWNKQHKAETALLHWRSPLSGGCRSVMLE